MNSNGVSMIFPRLKAIRMHWWFPFPKITANLVISTRFPWYAQTKTISGCIATLHWPEKLLSYSHFGMVSLATPIIPITVRAFSMLHPDGISWGRMEYVEGMGFISISWDIFLVQVEPAIVHNSAHRQSPCHSPPIWGRWMFLVMEPMGLVNCLVADRQPIISPLISASYIRH